MGALEEASSSGELGAVPLVSVEREAVDHQRVAEEAEVLAGVADAVGSSDPERRSPDMASMDQFDPA